MKKAILYLLLLLPFLATSQVGIKAGLNFANVTNAKSINSGTRTGYHAGIFLAASSKSLLSSRTEFLFSRQGYNFSTNENTGKVDLSYLLLPQFIAINITKYVQIQVGGQLAYLINAKVDTTTATGNQTVDNAINLFNRFDYGFGGGVEVHPVKMIVAGARLNISLGKLYKEPEPGQAYSFIPDIDIRNNLFQLYAGMKFGGD
ncbi:MAG TPA: porin family protein [Saprospiraceae bacterium]|nr:porin family protein [Saprospiraceae bacterium]